MKPYNARGIVLHTVKYSESSLVVYMLTDAIGRQTYMVQGVRSGRSKSNKAAYYQPFFALEFIGLQSDKMQMHRIKDVRSAFAMTSTPFDIRKSTMSLFISEVLYRVVREIEPDSPLFGFVWSSVEALDSIHDGISNFHLWFLTRLSYYLGFFPGNEYIPGAVFDIQEGVFTPIPPKHSVAMTRENSRLLGQLMDCDAGELSRIRLTGRERSEFLTSLISYFGYHLDTIHQVKSIQILGDIF